MSVYEFTPTPRLYVAVQDGCTACESMRPILAKLRSEHALEILVVERHLNRDDRNILGWSPSATPGFALVMDGKIVRKKTGTMSYRELLSWLAGRTRTRRRKGREEEEVAEDAEEESDEGEVSTPAEG